MSTSSDENTGTGPATQGDDGTAPEDYKVSAGEPNPTGTPAGIDVSEADLAEARAHAVAGDGETTVTTYEEAQEKGYYGTSPQREATGLDDKGLSQQSVLGDNAGEGTIDQPIPVSPSPDDDSTDDGS